MGPTEKLAGFISTLKFSDLPKHVIAKAKDTILDTVGCGLGGYTLSAEEIKPLLELVVEMGGAPECTIFGGIETNCLNAVLANSSISHTIDYDDTHVAALAHFGCCTVPVVLALAERTGAKGEEVITALVAGFEAGGKVARSVMPTHYASWHSTSTNGTIAAAGAAARLLNLDPAQTEMALGMAADQAAGGRYCLDFGDFTKSMHPGMAAYKGVLAALLAQKGAMGPKGFFEYRTGYCKVYSQQGAPEKISEKLGEPFEILSNDVKVYPSILCSHTPIQATLGIVRQNNISPANIKEIRVTIPALAEGQGCNYEPDSPLAARLSIPFCVALAASEKDVKIEDFAGDKFFDPEFRSLIKKVKIISDASLDRLSLPANVEIITSEAKSYSLSSPYPKGSGKNPMTRQEIEEKFFSLASHTLKRSQSEEIITIINHIEDFTMNKLTAQFKSRK